MEGSEDGQTLEQERGKVPEEKGTGEGREAPGKVPGGASGLLSSHDYH